MEVRKGITGGGGGCRRVGITLFGNAKIEQCAREHLKGEVSLYG